MKKPLSFKLAKDIAVLIPVDGPIVAIEAKSPTPTAAQDMVGGYVEAIQLMREGIAAQVLFNKDGLLIEGLPFNPRASKVVGRDLVGPVIILTGERRWT